MAKKIKVRRRVITFVDEMMPIDRVKNYIVEAKLFNEADSTQTPKLVIDLYKKANDGGDMICRCATIPCPAERTPDWDEEDLLEYARNNIPDNVDLT